MSSLQDPIRDGIARGWKIFGGTPSHSPEGTHKPLPASISADVAIIGSGAGAGVTAELLTKAGLSVVIIEEGPLKSSRDFNQREAEAYPSLYQESAARKTADKAINILQGRCVGGSTTVNWTSSFRTPEATLKFWQERYGLKDFTSAALDPFFKQAETRLNIGPWLTPPNENNDLLKRGATKLGIPASAINRNVKGCWNIGSCGMGCPTNAKQSMLVTTIPTALDAGATLLVETRAERLELANGRVTALFVQSVKPNGALAHTGSASPATKIIAKHYVLAAGAINSPAVLLRSKAVDPHSVLGKRTFLHPVVLSAAIMGNKVEAWTGAPQTIYSDHFLETQPIDGPIGYKLEAPPLHPVIFASTVSGYGAQQAALFKQFPFTHTLIALMRDGFNEQSAGGTVSLRSDGSPSIDYPLNAFVMDGARRALLTMMEIQFAAGAKEVMPVHELVAKPYTSWNDAKAAIAAMPMEPLLTKVVSAHVMGGCGLAGTEKQGVVRPDGVHWQIDNLSVHDGSIFPTSIGANPQLSIYGIVNRLAQGLAQRLSNRSVTLA
jgi:choline dehydrogenase-like flavoprotein